MVPARAFSFLAIARVLSSLSREACMDYIFLTRHIENEHHLSYWYAMVTLAKAL